MSIRRAAWLLVEWMCSRRVTSENSPESSPPEISDPERIRALDIVVEA